MNELDSTNCNEINGIVATCDTTIDQRNSLTEKAGMNKKETI